MHVGSSFALSGSDSCLTCSCLTFFAAGEPPLAAGEPPCGSIFTADLADRADLASGLPLFMAATMAP